MLDSLSAMVGTVDRTLNEAIEFVKTVAPHLWEIAVRQAFAEMWVSFGWAALGLVISVSMTSVWKRSWLPLLRRCSKDAAAAPCKGVEVPDLEVAGMVVTALFGVAAIIIFLTTFTSACRIALNPEWRALEILRSLP